MYRYDPTYILVIIASIIVAFAQYKVSSSYRRYKEVDLKSKLTGYTVAKMILEANNIFDVEITKASGRELSDHYDPRSKTIRLSSAVYEDASIASAAVAAHEVGHAIQHATGYKFLKIRNSLVPITNIASNLALPMLIIGLMLDVSGLITFALWAFSFSVIFNLVTLPVELNASKRALSFLKDLDIVQDGEINGCRSMLQAAAFTYVAALASSLLQFIRFYLLSSNRRRKE